FGSVIYPESAEKAARFMMDCNQKRVPLVFLHDVSGFMVGEEAEHSGIFRAGHYAMCGRAYDPRFVFAWPSARYAVMSGDAAARTLADIRIQQLERKGHHVDAAEQKAITDEVKGRYATALDPRYAAARLWVDAIIRPQDTRAALIT